MAVKVWTVVLVVFFGVTMVLSLDLEAVCSTVGLGSHVDEVRSWVALAWVVSGVAGFIAAGWFLMVHSHRKASRQGSVVTSEA